MDNNINKIIKIKNMDLNCYIYKYIMKKCGIIENVNNINKYKLYPSLLERTNNKTHMMIQKQKALFFFPH